MTPPINLDGDTVDAITMDGDSVSEVTVDGSAVFNAIPESEADSKLVHRWYLSEDSHPFVDQIGSADGTNNGTTQVTGSQYVDDAARSGDGTDDSIATTALGSYGSGMANDFAIAFTVDGYSGSTYSSAAGVRTADNTRLQPGLSRNTAGDIEFYIVDSDGNTLRVYTSSGYVDDGNRHRVVLNKTSNGASGLDIWTDQTQRSTTTATDQAFSAPTDFDRDFTLFAANDQGSITNNSDTILDDFCMFGGSLTQSEIESYTMP